MVVRLAAHTGFACCQAIEPSTAKGGNQRGLERVFIVIEAEHYLVRKLPM